MQSRLGTTELRDARWNCGCCQLARFAEYASLCKILEQHNNGDSYDSYITATVTCLFIVQCAPYVEWFHQMSYTQGRRHGFLSGGRIVGRWLTYPQNTLKIWKGTGFGPLHSRIWRGSPLLNCSLERTRPLRPSHFRRPCIYSYLVDINMSYRLRQKYRLSTRS